MVEIVPLHAFQDNYIWCLRNDTAAVVVDPGDAQPVLDYLSHERLELAAILVTHHHSDHVGGIAALRAHFNAPVYAPHRENIEGTTTAVRQGNTVTLPQFGLSFAVIDVPGHTLGHVAYYGANLLFCGDTLFGCGCGRLFEGTPQQMYASLQKLAALPDDTLVYCAHEYTLANLRFALAADPDNAALKQRMASAAELRQRGLPTLPATLALEKATNPFLRCGESALVAAARRHAGRPLHDAAEVFAALRQWKDHYQTP